MHIGQQYGVAKKLIKVCMCMHTILLNSSLTSAINIDGNPENNLSIQLINTFLRQNSKKTKKKVHF